MIYPEDQETILKWTNLSDHIKNPIGFPIGVTYGIQVAFIADKGYEGTSLWKNKEVLLFLGEIAGMRGHGIFVDQHGKVHWGYHLTNFYIIPEEGI